MWLLPILLFISLHALPAHGTDRPDGELSPYDHNATSIADLEPGLDRREDCEGEQKGCAGTKGKKPQCAWGNAFGCSKRGFCWQKCGPGGMGKWCWIAADQGTGHWITCDPGDDSQCSPAVPIVNDGDCGKGNCLSCGCSC